MDRELRVLALLPHLFLDRMYQRGCRRGGLIAFPARFWPEFRRTRPRARTNRPSGRVRPRRSPLTRAGIPRSGGDRHSSLVHRRVHRVERLPAFDRETIRATIVVPPPLAAASLLGRYCRVARGHAHRTGVCAYNAFRRVVRAYDLAGLETVLRLTPSLLTKPLKTFPPDMHINQPFIHGTPGYSPVRE